mgnify:CR=1 FL=1
MAFKLTIPDFSTIEGLHDTNTGMCKTTGCQHGQVGKHPQNIPSGKYSHNCLYVFYI